MRDLLSNANDAAIANTVISLGQNLGLEVIAEGVETEGQRNFLTSIGCHHFQGYLYSKPVPVADFEAYIRRVVEVLGVGAAGELSPSPV